MPTLYARIVTALCLVLAFFMPAVSEAQSTPACTTATLQTPLGPICGLQESVDVPGNPQPVTVSRFLGIRYAQTPARWTNPVPLPTPAWSGTLSATQFGSICAQNTSLTPGTCTPGGSEDCLFLNIYVPGNLAQGSKLPVMVFIHGGAFITGAGSGPLYDGNKLAASGDVILVTFNYRLGPLGFLALPGITDGSRNNFGFRDQIMALQWVQSYISFFGGDPGNVTIFGESAGAMSVGLHALSSPQSRGLFQSALMESNLLGLPYKTLAQADLIGYELGRAVDCRDPLDAASCMKKVPAETLVCKKVSQILPLMLFGLRDVLLWAPAIDKSDLNPNGLITGQPMASAAAGALTVPMVLGTNLNEGTVFAQLAQAIRPTEYDLSIDRMFGLHAKAVRHRYPCRKGTDCSKPLGQLISDYLFTCGIRAFADTVTSSSNPKPNLYLYQFTRVPPAGCNVWPQAPQCAKQVCHAQELPYVFDTPENERSGLCAFGTTNPADQTLSNNMGAYWTNFAKGQNPNASGLFQWPAFAPSQSYIILDQNLSVATVGPTDANCDLWNKIGYEVPTFHLRSDK